MMKGEDTHTCGVLLTALFVSKLLSAAQIVTPDTRPHISLAGIKPPTFCLCICKTVGVDVFECTGTCHQYHENQRSESEHLSSYSLFVLCFLPKGCQLPEDKAATLSQVSCDWIVDSHDKLSRCLTE